MEFVKTDDEGVSTNFFHQQDPDNNNSSSCSRSAPPELMAVEREHMFDKVVTPSDVGKLNRLVIPKQHAERYFPLDSTSTDKGLLLNFEDRSGKPWRFRYSYWNSSQSYVMTKGWSRFVKDKKLDAGDIVSFHRGRGHLHKDRLFIDWRRRPQTPLNSLRWGAARLFSLPPLHHPPNYNHNYHNAPHHHHRQLGYPNHDPHHQYVMNLGSEPVYYLRSSTSTPAYPMQQGRHVIDSVPLLHGRSGAAGKRLRLFGVNMECEMTNEDSEGERVVLPSTALLPHVSASPQFSEKGKSSLSFDLGL